MTTERTEGSTADPHPILDWPEWADVHHPDERTPGNKFSRGIRKTRSDLSSLMDTIDADWWEIEMVQSKRDPGVIIRWGRDVSKEPGRGEAVACDGYDNRTANLREAYLTIKEASMVDRRKSSMPNETLEAAAALPSAGEEAEAQMPAPEEVLGVQEDAPDEVIEAAARHLKGKHHPDGDEPDEQMFEWVKRAEDRLLDGATA